MVKRDVPKRVTLPKGRNFLARYKQMTRTHLLADIHLERPYKERAVPKGKGRRRRAIAQQGQGIGNIFRFLKKVAKSKVGQDIEKMALEQLPGVYEILSGKVKNKKLFAIKKKFCCPKKFLLSKKKFTIGKKFTIKNFF